MNFVVLKSAVLDSWADFEQVFPLKSNLLSHAYKLLVRVWKNIFGE